MEPVDTTERETAREDSVSEDVKHRIGSILAWGPPNSAFRYSGPNTHLLQEPNFASGNH